MTEPVRGPLAHYTVHADGSVEQHVPVNGVQMVFTEDFSGSRPETLEERRQRSARENHVRLAVRVPLWVKRKVEAEAARTGETHGQVVARLIDGVL